MIPLGNLRYDVVLKQEQFTNAATATSGNIDRLDSIGRPASACTIIIHGTTSDAATNNPSVLNLQECDTTVSTDFANVTGYVGDTGFTIPNSPTATTTAPFCVMNVDWRYRKRYLRVRISPVTTQTFSVIALSYRAGEAPVGTTEQNAAVIVNPA